MLPAAAAASSTSRSRASEGTVSVSRCSRKSGIWRVQVPPVTRIGFSMPEAPQHDAFFDESDAEGVRLRGEAACDGLEPVAVGVRLEHGHDPSGRHVRLDRGQVLAQTRQAHDGIRRAEACLFGIDPASWVHAPGARRSYGRRVPLSAPE